MKRFNFDELLWFIVLSLLDIWIIYLTITNKISFYIGNSITKYIYFAIIMISIMVIFQIKNIFTSKGNSSIKIKILPIILALILGVVSLYKLQTFKHAELSKELIENKASIMDKKSLYEHEFDYNASKNAKDASKKNNSEIVIVDDNNPMILEDIRMNPEKYIGKKLEIHGFVCKESYLNKNQFIIGRIIMTCCAADSKVVGIIGEYDKAGDLIENNKVKIKGRIGSSYVNDENNIKHNIPVIVVNELESES